MKIARLIIYEGPESWVERTLAASLTEGTHEFGEAYFIQVIRLNAERAIPIEQKARGYAKHFEEIDNA